MNAHFNTVRGLYQAIQNGMVSEHDICYVDENNAIYTHNRWYGLPQGQADGGD